MPLNTSQFPASTNPPNTTDLLPIMQGGRMKQTTLGALFTQLAAFLQSGTGALATDVQTELRKIVRASQFSGSDFGVKLQAAHDALTSAGGIIDCSDMVTTQSVATQVNISKPVWIVLPSATVNGPTTGYIFKNTSNDVTIEGSGSTNLVQGAGSSGIIQSVDADRFQLRRFKIDMNNVANAKGIYILGGWYPQLDQIWSNKGLGVVASSSDLYIESTAAGSGSRLALVGDIKDCVFQRVTLKGADATHRVTTMTFTRLDASFVLETQTLASTFIGGTIQNTSGTMFTLTNVSGHVALGVDIEGSSSTVYAFSGSNRGIHSLDNEISGSTMTYTSGTLPSSSYFMDDNQGVAITGQIKGYCGSTEALEFANSGWTDKHRVGTTYSGDQVAFSANLSLTSATQGNLDNTGSGGAALLLLSGGAAWKLVVATAGGNPRTLSVIASGDTTGDLAIGQALVALGGGAAPTLGTIGGSGPASAAQNTWLRLKDSTGAAFWVPAWK